MISIALRESRSSLDWPISAQSSLEENWKASFVPWESEKGWKLLNMVTFQEIPDEIEQPKKKEEIEDDKEVIQKPPEPFVEDSYCVFQFLQPLEPFSETLLGKNGLQ